MFMKDFTRTARATAIAAPVTTGLVAGTRVETASGWRAVESLRIGDAVQTLDGGLTRILALDRRSLPAEADQPLIRIPGGSFDCCSDLVLLPGQPLLIDTLGDPDLADDLFVMLPAAALWGREGVTRFRPAAPVEVITPLFAEEEALYANSGALLHCPGLAGAGSRPTAPGFFTRLDIPQARAFLTRRMERLAA